MVKVLIKRRLKNASIKEASEILIQARYNAMGAKGYISSETLTSCDDPSKIVVISMWQKKEDWDVYDIPRFHNYFTYPSSTSMPLPT
jgi:heme-degrading monooxygenase HmoA